MKTSSIKNLVDSFELALHPEKMQDVLDSLGISWVNEALLGNPSKEVPYHNNKHTLSVALNAYEGGIAENSKSLKEVVVAAIFHDFSHTAGKEKDNVNIETAISFLHLYGKEHLTDKELKNISELIDSTHYPYRAEPKNKEQAILRDSDLMQIYETKKSDLFEIYSGLKTEFEVSKKAPISNEDFLQVNKNFHATTVWHTDWANKKSEKFKPQCEKLYEVLSGDDLIEKEVKKITSINPLDRITSIREKLATSTFNLTNKP